MQQPYDVIIIGAGYAGLSGALWLGRYRRKVLVLGSGPSRNHLAGTMHGYPGYEGVSPQELLKKIRQEALGYPIELLDDTVITARQDEAGFTVQTSGAKTFSAKRLLLATGCEEVLMDIPGFSELEGKSIWHCPACDGYEYTGKRISVVGWGAEIADYASLFLTYSRDVTVLTHGNQLDNTMQKTLEAKGISIIDRKINNVAQRAPGKTHDFTLEGGRTHNADATFYKLPASPRIGLARSLGCELINDTCVAVNSKQESTVTGVYIAGDISPFEDLVVVACSTGAIAASNIHKSL